MTRERCGQIGRRRRRSEGPGIHEAFGVDGTKTGMQSAPQLIESVKQVREKRRRHETSP